jgi:pimeloyl-ACP methyl ester carboxylesterase
VPDLKLVPIAKATHWVVHEKPERVIQEITGFLAPSPQ